MLDPFVAIDGNTYEYEAILHALDQSMISPVTQQLMQNKAITPDFRKLSQIMDFLAQHPECWSEVYISTMAVNDLLALSSGEVIPTHDDLRKWIAILRHDPRLLTLPLFNQLTLLEHLCNQNEVVVKNYLPVLFDLLTIKDWEILIRQQHQGAHPAQDWLKLVAQTCYRCNAMELAELFLQKLRENFRVNISPLDMAEYAINQGHLGLFKLGEH